MVGYGVARLTHPTGAELLAAIEARSLTAFARIDHTANAAAVNMHLRPTQVIIFGAAKGDTPLMQEQQTAGRDSLNQQFVSQLLSNPPRAQVCQTIVSARQLYKLPLRWPNKLLYRICDGRRRPLRKLS